MKHICLLRGINVSGQKKIKMADLKTHFEDLGFVNVVTYIQSGNILFDSSEKDQIKLASLIKNKIASAYGFEVPTLVLSPSYLTKINKANPYLKDYPDEIKSLYYTFLAGKPEKSKIDLLYEVKYKSDEIKVQDKVVYVYVPGGYGKTKFSNTLIENKLKVQATTRNWKTVNKLIELSKA